MMTLADKAGYGKLIRSGKVSRDNIEYAVNCALEYKSKIKPAPNCSLEINKITALIDASSIGD